MIDVVYFESLLLERSLQAEEAEMTGEIISIMGRRLKAAIRAVS